MLTPKFSLLQTEEDITIQIYAQFAKISDTEIYIHENSFTFYSSPYYLRLTLPGNLIDSEKEVHTVKYDADHGLFTVCCKKETIGQFFSGLDMLTDLLTPKGAEGISQPCIEVLSASESCTNSDSKEELNWFVEQTIPKSASGCGFRYGFGNIYTGVFSTIRSELCGVVDIADPDIKACRVRREERLASETSKFDEQHYLADLFESDIAEQYLLYKPSFYSLKPEEVRYLTCDEEALLKLPRKELLVDMENKTLVFLSLIDIIFAWCYNHRITLGENCCESAWNIAKLSSTLSWLDSFQSLKEVVQSCMRRTLIYPLVRNWKLTNCIFEDTVQVFSLGKKQILKCLLEVQRLFNSYEPFYILNQIYINDYCIWIQNVKNETLVLLVDSLRKVTVEKEEMNLDLDVLESAAQMAVEEDRRETETQVQNNLNNIVNSFDHLSVIENNFALSGNHCDSSQEVVLNNSCSYSVAPELDSSTDSDDSDSDSSSDSSSSDDSDDVDCSELPS